ncbi:MAG: polysaccharide biosynthesis/export family protein [Gemmataceae bacterium]
MLLIRRLKLLSGVAVLLALSTASTGCRSCMTCCPEGCCSSQPVEGGEGVTPGCPCNTAASLGRPVARYNPQPTFASRPLWKLSQSRCEPTPMPSGYQAGCQQCQQQRQNACATCNPQPQPVTACSACSTQPQQGYVAMMLRPVPAGQALPEGTGVWSPVRRVSNEAPPLADGGIQQAVSASQAPPAMALPPLPSLGDQAGAPAPMPQVPPILVAQAEAGRDDPPPSKDAPDKPSGNKVDQLPPPRMKSGPKKPPAATGWPEIPAPVVTNPPHAPREFQKHALSAYIIEPPDVLRIDASTTVVGTRQLPIEGPHLVRPDGTIGLGTFGAVFVAGMTLDQAKMQIIEAIMRGVSQTQGGEPDKKDKDDDPDKKKGPLTLQDYWQAIRVDVAAFNSKFYYVIADGGGYGETVVRVPCTGNETVLDAISQIQGLPAVASKKKIWVARATPQGHHPMVLPVDWYAVTQGGSAATNYQVFPGDRVYVNSDCRIRIDSHLAKFISPIERLFGVTLLGATTVNAINGNQGGAGNRGF